MKHKFLKTIGTWVSAILMLAWFAPIWVAAQQDDSIETTNLEELSDERANERDLEGSWNTTVTFRNCQTGAAIFTFPAMNTFARGGTLQEYGVGSAPLTRGPGHGVWRHLNGRRYSSAFQFFRFNADGTFWQTIRSRRQIELSRSGNSYTSINTNEFFDTNGNLVMTGCATEAGTRFE